MQVENVVVNFKPTCPSGIGQEHFSSMNIFAISTPAFVYRYVFTNLFVYSTVTAQYMKTTWKIPSLLVKIAGNNSGRRAFLEVVAAIFRDNLVELGRWQPSLAVMPHMSGCHGNKLIHPSISIGLFPPDQAPRLPRTLPFLTWRDCMLPPIMSTKNPLVS